MPHTIACVNPKGGTGKTTVAIHLAVAPHRSGYPTKLVAADPQGTALDWSRRTPDEYDSESSRPAAWKPGGKACPAEQIGRVVSPELLPRLTGSVSWAGTHTRGGNWQRGSGGGDFPVGRCGSDFHVRFVAPVGSSFLVLAEQLSSTKKLARSFNLV